MAIVDRDVHLDVAESLRREIDARSPVANPLRAVPPITLGCDRDLAQPRALVRAGATNCHRNVYRPHRMPTSNGTYGSGRRRPARPRSAWAPSRPAFRR